MGIDFANVTEQAPALLTAQIEVYPSLFTNLAADLGFMCGHFSKLQSGYATCDKGDKLKKGLILFLSRLDYHGLKLEPQLAKT